MSYRFPWLCALRRSLAALAVIVIALLGSTAPALAYTGPGPLPAPLANPVDFASPNDSLPLIQVTTEWYDVNGNRAPVTAPNCQGWYAEDGLSIVTADTCGSNPAIGQTMLSRAMTYTGNCGMKLQGLQKMDGPSGPAAGQPSRQSKYGGASSQNLAPVIDAHARIMVAANGRSPQLARMVDEKNGLALLRIDRGQPVTNGMAMSVMTTIDSGMEFTIPQLPEFSGGAPYGTSGRNSVISHDVRVTDIGIMPNGSSGLGFDGRYSTIIGSPVLDKDGDVVAVAIDDNVSVTAGGNMTSTMVTADKVKELLVANNVIESDAQLAADKAAQQKDKDAAVFAKTTDDRIKALEEHYVPKWEFSLVSLILGAIAIAGLVFGLIARDNARIAWGDLTVLRTQIQQERRDFGPNDRQ